MQLKSCERKKSNVKLPQIARPELAQFGAWHVSIITLNEKRLIQSNRI